MAPKPTTAPPPEPVTYYQLVGYTLRCWPQSHFYSSNLIEILNEYDVPTFEAKKALSTLRGQGFAEYCHRPPGLWRVRGAAKNFPVHGSHAQIYAALVEATKANIDARLADTQPPDTTRVPTFRGVDYRHIVSAALQIWPHGHFEARHLARYCDQFAARVSHPSARSNHVLKEVLVDDGRLWFSPVITRLGRITLRGRMGPLGHKGPELLAAMRNHPPMAVPPWHDYVVAYALEHPGEWKVAHLMRWVAAKEGAPNRGQAMDCLKRLEHRQMVEQIQAGTRSLDTIFRTRPALYGTAASDLTLYEQLLHPEGGQLAERCFPDGRPEDLPQIGRVAPGLVDDTTVTAQTLPSEQGLKKLRTPGAAQVVTLKGLNLETAPAPVTRLASSELSNLDIVSGLVDYINELRAGAGVTEVARLRCRLDNLNGALQKSLGQNSQQVNTIHKLNAIKGQLETQVKELSSELAAANNRLQAAKQNKRPPVRTHREKGTGFGLGEVATFKGRPLSIPRTPEVENKRARG